MPFSEDRKFGMMLVGSAAFFLSTIAQVFVFHSVPQMGDWVQLLAIPLVAMVLYHMVGSRLDAYFEDAARRKSYAVMWLFISYCLLLFIPICIIVIVSP